MNTQRRDILLALGLAPLAAPFVARRARAEAPIMIGHLYAQDFDPAFVALDRDFFGKHGLAAKSQPMTAAPMVPPALVSGSVQIASGSPVILLQANDAGLDLVAIAGVSRESAKHPTVSFLARKGSGILTPADLPGHKVGCVGLNTSFWLFAQAWLDARHVPREHITFVEFMSPRMEDALRNKTIDACLIFNPMRDRILNDGLAINLGDYWVQTHDNIMSSSWLTTRAWAEANRDKVAAFRAALREAVAWIPDHVAETKAIEAKYAGNSWPGFPDFAIDLTVEDVDIYAQQALKYGLIRKMPDIPSIIFP